MSTYGTVPRLLIVALVGSLGCLAQSTAFGLSSGSASPGSTVTLDLSMATSTAVTPASVEWTLNYPANDFSSATVTSGSVAAGANKSVSCNNAAGSSTCVLWGDNSTSMASGVIATISLVVASGTPDTSSAIQLSVPMAADPSGFPLVTSATSGEVTILQPAGLNGFSCFPIALTPPATATCTLQLSSNAPGGGATVALTASPADATFPATFQIPAGVSSASFTVTPTAVTAPTAMTLTASYLGVNEGFGLNLNPAPPILMAVSVGPSNLLGGQTASGLVTLSAPAGAGGALVSLSSSNPSIATVPASVTVPQGATTATFSVQTVAVTGSASVVLTGSYSGASLQASLSLNPAPALSGVFVSPGVMVGSINSSGTVSVTAPAPSGGIVVLLSSSNTSAVTVPASVTIPQGATTASFTVTTDTVTTPTAVLVTASYLGVNMIADLTINPRPHALNGIQISPNILQSGQTAVGTVTLAAAAGPAGVVVYLVSSNPSAIAVPASVTVPGGSTSATFKVTAGVVTVGTSVAVTALHGGIQTTAYLTVRSHQSVYRHGRNQHATPDEIHAPDADADR